jgi:hypothetical protein
MKAIKIITDERGPDGQYITKVLMDADEKEAIKELIESNLLTMLENFNFPSRDKAKMQELVVNLKGLSRAKTRLANLLLSNIATAVATIIATYMTLRGH